MKPHNSVIYVHFHTQTENVYIQFKQEPEKTVRVLKKV